MLLILAGCSDHTITGKVSEPAVTITVPGEDATFWVGEPVTFEATAGGGAGDYSWYWSAGALGALSGAVSVVGDDCAVEEDQGFPEGDWTITVLVTDADARSAEDFVDIHVVQNEPPTVVFTSGAGSYGDCEEVPVSVTVFDPDSDLAGVTLEWSGLPEGAVPPSTVEADGSASFVIDPQAVGAWTLGVSATDAEGGGGEDTAALVVTACVQDLCNGVDDDGDGMVDEDAPTSTWYADADGDGHGDPGVAMDACAQPDSYVSSADDCDDEDSEVYPGALERCNEMDDDCDGEIDEGASGSVLFGMPTAGEVHQAATDGSGVALFASGFGSVSALAIDGDTLWGGAWGPPAVQRVELDSTGYAVVYNGAGSGGQGVAVDEASGQLFYGEYYGDLWVGVPDGAIAASVLVSRTDIETLIGGYDGIGVGLEYDPSTGYVYFFTRSNAGISGRHILRVYDDGTGLEELRQIESQCLDLDLVNGKIYFADNPAGVPELWRTDLDGGGEEYLFDLVDGSTCSGVAVDGDAGRVYYLQDQTGTVWSANVDGSDHQELASGFLYTQGLALIGCGT